MRSISCCVTEELRLERLRQAKVLYVESSNKNTSLKNLLGFNLFFSLGFGVVRQYLHVQSLSSLHCPQPFKTKGKEEVPSVLGGAEVE